MLGVCKKKECHNSKFKDLFIRREGDPGAMVTLVARVTLPECQGYPSKRVTMPAL